METERQKIWMKLTDSQLAILKILIEINSEDIKQLNQRINNLENGN